jgi:hypothetical protein
LSAESIYNFEIVIPEAVKRVLTATGVDAYTLADAPQFQQNRPRVEITYRHISETTPKRVALMADRVTKRTSCFRGELKLHAITEADDVGRFVHSLYRARIRNVLATLEQSLNNGILTEHAINFVVSGNETTGTRTQDGFMQTTFPYTVDISIQKDAWGTL